MSEMKPENRALFEAMRWPAVAEGVPLPGASKTSGGSHWHFELPAYALDAILDAAREEGRAEIRALWGKAVARD